MNYRNVTYALSLIMMIIGLSMLFPALWSFYYGEIEAWAFLLSSGAVFLVSLIAYKTTEMGDHLLIKEVYCIVSLAWLLASFFGALPYLITGTFTSFTDAFFETMSGFTTTGASVLSDVENLPRGILFWRSMTCWLGGMGIIVLFVALLATLGTGGEKMFQAESPGASMVRKFKPRISDAAKVLWRTYLLLTAGGTVGLYLLGMPLFDALCHSFGCVSTGGISTKNAGLGFYDQAGIQWAVTILMYLSGANFALYYLSWRVKTPRPFFRDSEFRVYTYLILLAVILIGFNLTTQTGAALEDTIRPAVFHVVSFLTTTGYVAADYTTWPLFSTLLLMLLMLSGACAGSTSGGMKIDRMLVMFKQSVLTLRHHLHPRAVFPLKLDHRVMEQEKIMAILQFFFLYIIIVMGGTLLMAAQGLDLASAFTAVAASISNSGVGLGQVGPGLGYGFLSSAGKYFLAFLMLLGRLELFTVLVLLLPAFWRRD